MTGISELDERFAPAVELVGRTGATNFQIRFCEEEKPVVWIAIAQYENMRGSYEVAAAVTPVLAVFRLCAELIDGGYCQHCQKPSAFSEDFDPMPAKREICWYQWDPELKTFRRGCE